MVNVHVMILPYWFFVQTFSTVSKEAPIKRLSKKMDALKIWAISLQSAYGWWDPFFSKFARWRSSAVLKIISFTNILQDFCLDFKECFSSFWTFEKTIYIKSLSKTAYDYRARVCVYLFPFTIKTFLDETK